MQRQRDGFTLVETVVTVAVLALLLGFLLTAFLSAGHIYRSVADANLLQTKSIHAISFLKDSVQNSSELQIITSPPGKEDGYSYIWCEGGKLYYRNSGKPGAEYMQDTGFAVTFTGKGSRLGVKLEVLTDGKPYVLESAVALQNVPDITGVQGGGIRFKTIPNTTG